MAAPKGRSYTPSRGPLAGQTFTAPANARGETAAYNAYQNALGRHYGFSSYAGYKAQRLTPFYQVIVEKQVAKGHSRASAAADARRILGDTRIDRHSRGRYQKTDTGRRMRDIIKQMYDEGIYDYGEDVDESIYYE